MKVCLLLLMIVVVGGTVRAQEADKIAAAEIDKVLHHCSDHLAITHKRQAESLVSRWPILKGGFPAMSEEEWRIYDSLPTQPVISAKRRGSSSGRRSKN